MPSRFALLATALLLSLPWAARPHARSSPVGASPCASCHTRIHDTWKSGRHSKMVQPATPASVIEDNATVQADLGVIALLSGEVDLAASALLNSLALEPGRPSATFLLALARLGQQRADEARGLLKRVPRSDPHYNAAQERLKQLESAPRGR
jgi:hypothetical protein